MPHTRRRPAGTGRGGRTCESVRANAADDTTAVTTPPIDAARAAAKAAIVHSAIIGAIDATRVHTVIRLLRLEAA